MQITLQTQFYSHAPTTERAVGMQKDHGNGALKLMLSSGVLFPLPL